MGTVTALPPTQFAATPDGGHVAYWSFGRGPAMIEVPHVQMSHLRMEWRIEAVRVFCERMACRHRFVRFNGHGGGAGSCPPRFDLATLASDIDAVATALKLERFALFGMLSGSLPAIHYAAHHPERVSALVLWNGFARNADHGEHPRLRSLFEMAESDWELFTESICQAALGWHDAEASRQWAAVVREASSPETFRAYLAARREWDVSDLLPEVRAPTLVLHDESNRLANEERCRELAAGIPNARLVSSASRAGMPDDHAMDAVERFLMADGIALPAGVDGLTPRETQVLARLASGAGNAAIAGELGISINTVTRHLTHIYTKTGAANRTAAVRYAIEHGLVLERDVQLTESSDRSSRSNR